MPDAGLPVLRPPLGATFTALLVLLAILACLSLYASLGRRSGVSDGPGPWRRGLLLAMRFSGLAALAWMLAGPAVFEAAHQHASAVPLVVLVDRSASMAQVDVPRASGAVSRWQALVDAWLTPAVLDRLRGAATLRLVGFDNTAGPFGQQAMQGPEPTGRATHLFEALEDLLPPAGAAQRPGVVLVLSDGHDTQRGEDPALAERYAKAGWRVFASPVGRASHQPDLALSAWVHADTLFEGQSTTLEVMLARRGVELPIATVELWLDDQLLETRELRFEAGAIAARGRFELRPAADGAAGPSVRGYRVQVPALSDESRLDNNHRWAFVQVGRQRMKVAMFEGQAYWDSRFLAQVLRDDAMIDLTTFHDLGPGRVLVVRSDGGAVQSGATEPSASIDDLDLSGFDVVILGRRAEQFFPGDAARRLVEYVTQHGGSLVLARGPAFDMSTDAGRQAQQILAAIEPVEWGRQTVERLRLQVTPAGHASPLLDFESLGSAQAVLTRLPDMLAATRIERERAASIVLLRQTPHGQESAGMAAMAHQSAGRGRVLAVLTSGMWRWAFLPSGQRQYESVYQAFWSRTLRWLALGGEFLPGQRASLVLDRLSIEPGQTLTATASFRWVPEEQIQPTMLLLAPDGSQKPLSVSRVSPTSVRFVAQVQADSPGLYHVRLETPGLEPPAQNVPLAVYDQSAEMMDTSARPDVLARFTQATGGACLEPGDVGSLIDHLQQVAAARSSDRTIRYVFDHPPALIVLCAALFLEWFLRRRWGGL